MLVAVLLSGAALWFGTGLHPYWPLLWLAPVPVLLVVARESFRLAFIVSAASWALGGLNEWTYYRTVIPSPPVIVLAIAAPAVFFSLAVWLWKFFVDRGKPICASLGYAAVWTCLEFYLARTSPHSTFGSVAYSQMDNLVVLQIAALAGTPGITFLLFFLPGLGVAAKLLRTGRTAALICLVIAILGITTYGARLQHLVPHNTLPVGLIASDASLEPRQPDEVRAILLDYSAQALPLITNGARLVVMPEKTALLTDQTISIADRILGDTARQGAYVAIGFERWTPSAKLNEIRVYAPDGRLAATYEKHHMLPAFEANLLPGTSRVLLSQPSGKWGFQICKDMDFPALSREYGINGAGLIVVPAWDFVSDGWLHGRMAIMRGVESGFSIVRAPKQGVLGVSDSAGRVLAEKGTSAAGFVTLRAVVPVQHVTTLYSQWRDWFGWVNVALLVVILSRLFTARRPRNREIHEPSRPSTLAETRC